MLGLSRLRHVGVPALQGWSAICSLPDLVSKPAKSLLEFEWMDAGALTREGWLVSAELRNRFSTPFVPSRLHAKNQRGYPDVSSWQCRDGSSSCSSGRAFLAQPRSWRVVDSERRIPGGRKSGSRSAAG